MKRVPSPLSTLNSVSLNVFTFRLSNGVPAKPDLIITIQEIRKVLLVTIRLSCLIPAIPLLRQLPDCAPGNDSSASISQLHIVLCFSQPADSQLLFSPTISLNSPYVPTCHSFLVFIQVSPLLTLPLGPLYLHRAAAPETSLPLFLFWLLLVFGSCHCWLFLLMTQSSPQSCQCSRLQVQSEMRVTGWVGNNSRTKSN